MPKKKASKEEAEMSKRINEILGIAKPVDFIRLGKEELEKLHKFVSTPSNLMGIGVRALRLGVAQEAEGPIRELLNRPLKDIIGQRGNGEDKGPLGLGLLPKLRGR